MVTVPFRWIVADQMQKGRPAANTIAFDFQHTGNGFVQKPLRNLQDNLIPPNHPDRPLAARNQAFQMPSFLVGRANGGVPSCSHGQHLYIQLAEKGILHTSRQKNPLHSYSFVE